MNANSDLRPAEQTLRPRPSRVVRILLAMTASTESQAAIRRDEFPFLQTPRLQSSRPLDLLDSQLIDRKLTS